MARQPKLIDVPALRRRSSSYGQGKEQQEDYVTRTELLDLLRNMADSELNMDATDTIRDDEPIRTVLQYIGPSGTATNTKLLPVSKTANLGCVINPLPLSAADVGSDATITVASFTAYFDFGNLSVSGASITGLAFSTFYYVYLTGFDYSDGSYTSALATTAGTTLVNDPDNFYVGSITTPANGAGGTSGSGGGGAVVPGGDIEP